MQEELNLNHEPSLDHWARALADNDVETGEILNWDHAYESAWMYLLELKKWQGWEAA